jgi:ABC-2 type transport system permease protein
VITSAFRSEWIKLRRRGLLFGTFGGLTIAASLFSILTFTQAAPVGPGRAGLPSLQQLAEPNGLIHGLDFALILLGIVAFGLAAAQMASEYSLGTLRQLLVRQPRRSRLLAGKYLAVVSFIVLAIVVAAVLTGIVDVVLAHLRHVPVKAWFTSTGMGDLTKALGELLLAAAGFATLGMAVGLFLKSSVFAVIVGFAYLLPIEMLIERIFPATKRWLPGQLLTDLGKGGVHGSSFSRSLIISLIYLTVVGAATAVTFMRRDVTA